MIVIEYDEASHVQARRASRMPLVEPHASQEAVEPVVIYIRLEDRADLVDTLQRTVEARPNARVLLVGSSRCATVVAEIRSVSVNAAARNDGPALTRREAQVLTAIKAGLTNREIATSLRISLSTANKHVEGILRKRSARNRAQAAAESLVVALPIGIDHRANSESYR